MRRDPETIGLAPRRRPAPRARAAAARRTGRPAAAMRTRAFWLLFAVFGATWIPVFVPLVHLVPMARGLGVAAAAAPRPSSARSAPPRWSAACSWGARPTGSGGGRALAVALALQSAAFVGFALARELPGALRGGDRSSGSPTAPARPSSPPRSPTTSGASTPASLAGLLFALAGSMAAWGPLAAGFIYDRAGELPARLVARRRLQRARPARPRRRPGRAASRPARLDAPRRARVEVPARRIPWPLKDKYCIVGVGETEYSRAVRAQHPRDGGRGGPQRHARRRARQGRRGRHDVLPERRLRLRQLRGAAISASGSTSTWTSSGAAPPPRP